MRDNIKFIPILNFLRGTASLGVCAVHIHYTVGLYKYPLFSRIVTNGQQGVAMFFVISGFIIPYSLYNSKYELKYFFSYILKRSLRIDPPYFVSILLCFMVWRLGSRFNMLCFISHFFYLIPFSQYQWYNSVYWTLGIEFQYYLFIGLTFGFLKSGNIKVLILILMFLSMVGYFIPIGFFFNKKNDNYLTMNLHYFCMGIIVFLHFIKRLRLIQTHFILFGITLYLCKFISVTTGFIGYLSCLLILHVNFRTVITDFFGKISYSLYLIHLPLSGLIISLLSKKITNLFFLYFVTIVSCILFAFLFNRLIEIPAITWSKEITFKDKISAK